MKTKILFTTILSIFLFTSCGIFKNSKTHDKGVVINGVTWATRNVDNIGTFVSNPKDDGKYYTYEEAQNACPIGWRLPTREEFEKLSNKDKVTNKWGTRTCDIYSTIFDVEGRIFANKTFINSIFLPAAGDRANCGTLVNLNRSGSYWSSTPNGINGFYLYFDEWSVEPNRYNEYRGGGLSVRCVAK